MNLDYDDWSHGGGHVHFVPGGSMPFSMYKLSPEFREKQMYKPQYDTRNPSGTTVKRWEVQGGTCVEMRGTRSWFGQCDCGCWIYSERDVSTPEFRGRGNSGPKGRWPEFCDGCRQRRREESLQRRSAAKRKADRERIAEKRMQEPDERDQPKYVEGHWFRDERGEEQWSEGYWVRPG